MRFRLQRIAMAALVATAAGSDATWAVASTSAGPLYVTDNDMSSIRVSGPAGLSIYNGTSCEEPGVMLTPIDAEIIPGFTLHGTNATIAVLNKTVQNLDHNQTLLQVVSLNGTCSVLMGASSGSPAPSSTAPTPMPSALPSSGEPTGVPTTAEPTAVPSAEPTTVPSPVPTVVIARGSSSKKKDNDHLDPAAIAGIVILAVAAGIALAAATIFFALNKAPPPPYPDSPVATPAQEFVPPYHRF